MSKEKIRALAFRFRGGVWTLFFLLVLFYPASHAGTHTGSYRRRAGSGDPVLGGGFNRAISGRNCRRRGARHLGSLLLRQESTLPGQCPDRAGMVRPYGKPCGIPSFFCRFHSPLRHVGDTLRGELPREAFPRWFHPLLRKGGKVSPLKETYPGRSKRSLRLGRSLEKRTALPMGYPHWYRAAIFPAVVVNPPPFPINKRPL